MCLWMLWLSLWCLFSVFADGFIYVVIYSAVSSCKHHFIGIRKRSSLYSEEDMRLQSRKCNVAIPNIICCDICFNIDPAGVIAVYSCKILLLTGS